MCSAPLASWQEKFEASPDEDTNKASHFNIELSFKIDYLCTPGREGIIGNYKNKIYYGFTMWYCRTAECWKVYLV